MMPADGQVVHFSEDPTITRFVPHVAATAQQTQPYVWALGPERAPCYWFPRQCPRGTAWVGPGTTDDDHEHILGTAAAGARVHAIEYEWLQAMRTTRLYMYRFATDTFRPSDDLVVPSAFVSTEPVAPLGPPEPVGDLVARHEEAGIELRVLPNLWPFWDVVTTSTLEFSGIRLANARPRQQQTG
jgi:hypothetical protein